MAPIRLADTDDPIDICLDNVFWFLTKPKRFSPKASGRRRRPASSALPHHAWSFAVGKTP
jgi:hypothetical protein